MEHGLLSVAVIGGGFLGCKIAAEFAMSGGAVVRIFDSNIKLDQLKFFVENEIYKCERLFPSDSLLAKRYMEEAVARVTPVSSIKDAVETADIVSEAVVETLAVKIQIFRECEYYASPKCIFTTNTLTVSLKDIQNALSNPERLIGLRFLAPVCFIPFVEISTTGDVSSADSSASKVVHYMSDIGKICFRYRLDHDISGAISTATAASSGLTATSLFHARQQAGQIRLRLNDDEVWRHQYRESRIRFGLATQSDSETICCVCLTEPPSVLLASCGHQVLCKECARTIQSQGRGACPICRLPIRGVEEIIR